MVVSCAQQITCFGCTGVLFASEWDQFSGLQGFKLTLNCVLYSVERNAHLISQSPACSIIRWYWWSARILEIIGMVLGFKHVKNMRTKSLIAFYDEGTSRIGFAVVCKSVFCLVHNNACSDQSIEKTFCCGEVALIGWDNICPGITQLGIAEDTVVVLHRDVADVSAPSFRHTSLRI